MISLLFDHIFQLGIIALFISGCSSDSAGTNGEVLTVQTAEPAAVFNTKDEETAIEILKAAKDPVWNDYVTK